ncbi:hypothetical protein SLS58_006096 [Diplodia intermedia]|uniref:Uncharacterized protein n=1 Tax=Diplodia intermedia TaxID=856260 RepID=A0ABR3TP62_9PEZI
MAGGPTRLRSGANLSYQSSYWIAAAIKAARNRHWVLFLVTLGTSLSPILTISMSALFERSTGTVVHSAEIPRHLELRTVPFLFETDRQISVHEDNPEKGQVITNLFKNLSTNWMYGATIQLALNGTEPVWSRDGWSFVPLDLSNLPNDTMANYSDTTPLSPAVNYSVSTPAVRARFECTPYQDLSNTSTWLLPQNLSDTSTWNVSRNPDGAEIGYLIGSKHPVDDDSEFLDTTVEGHLAKVKCCVNETDGQPGKGSAIGYWSQNNIVEYNSLHAPMNFTTKWIHGDAVIGSYDELVGSGSRETHERLLFIDQPRAAALHCVPTIETADANVVVDRGGQVQSFSITGDPTATDAPWEDEFVVYLNANDLDHVNVTASYGVLFQESLLSSSHITRVSPDTTDAVPDEDEADQAFNVRDRGRGLNLDFMTYAMYSLVADKNPSALLDAATMDALARRTFSTFFQHYASTSSPPATSGGGWAFQRPNATLPPDLGAYYNGDPVLPPRPSTNGTAATAAAMVRISQRTDVLAMNAAAVWLSVAILAWLAATAAVVAGALRLRLRRRGRSYLRGLDRDVAGHDLESTGAKSAEVRK